MTDKKSRENCKRGYPYFGRRTDQLDFKDSRINVNVKL
jgi:hypothetical protein